ncbi:hypothetical protein EDD15DRAFT_2281256 [Pisolithus albus]|nr:hypothetical protein EDD15DRAFT_2281256 [Pisolithus albus]
MLCSIVFFVPRPCTSRPSAMALFMVSGYLAVAEGRRMSSVKPNSARRRITAYTPLHCKGQVVFPACIAHLMMLFCLALL